MRQLLLLLGASLALAAAAAALPPHQPAAAASELAVQRCRTSSLVVWLDTRAEGAAGSVYYHLELTNLSGRACTLLGYPGVSAAGFAGQQLGAAAGRLTGRPVRVVTLANGASAAAVLRVVQVGNYPSARCRRTTGAGLRVYPPGDTVSKIVPFPVAACRLTGAPFLDVGPVGKA